jgi:hypothetical protein
MRTIEHGLGPSHHPEPMLIIGKSGCSYTADHRRQPKNQRKVCRIGRKLCRGELIRSRSAPHEGAAYILPETAASRART